MNMCLIVVCELCDIIYIICNLGYTARSTTANLNPLLVQTLEPASSPN